MRYAALIAGRTRAAISLPCSRSTRAMSYWLCMSSQKRAPLPKYRPSRTAVSAETERRPLRMSVMRPDGTPSAIASRLALSLRASSSILRRRPGWEGRRIGSSFVIVDDLDIVGVPVMEREADPPACVDRHRPLTAPIAFQLVQPDAVAG